MTVKKAVLMISILVFSMLICAAADTNSFFKLNDRITVVDLGTNLLFSHKDSAKNNNVNVNSYNTDADFYYRNQTVLTTGILNANGGAIKLSVDSLDDWYYVLSEDTEYKRPFGIDVFVRGRYDDSDVDVSEQSGIMGIHLGLQAKNQSEPAYVLIPANIVSQYSSIWFDVCLVFDPLIDANTDTVTIGGATSNLISSDAYYLTSLEFTIECGDMEDENHFSDTYVTQLMGYYKPTDTEAMQDNSAFLFVEKHGYANGININEAYHTGNWYEIATYDFSTASRTYSVRVNDPGYVYIFLSSEADGLSDSRFTLLHTGAVNPQEQGGQFNNSINYVLRIVPEPNGYGTVDGSSYFTGVSSPTSIGPEWLKISGELRPYNNTNAYARWYNRGTIELAILSNEQDTPQYELPVPDSMGQGRINLASGSYTSVIYVHVVTDFR
ncbi:MAG: hypothetical protein II903_01790 [Spirochaetales bacterium]|nr:hypothetical protein [Spirochaetales bacterium]